MEERIIELEKKVSFQEHMIEELNEVVLSQQQNIGAIEKQLSFLKENLAAGDLVKKQDDEESPPHY